VTGPAWPSVDEEKLEEAAAQYEAWAAKMTGNVVPEQSGRLMTMQDNWQGASSVAAAGEATQVIASHEANAAQAASIALRLHGMAAAVVEAKTALNAAAEEVQAECTAMQAMPVQNKEQLIQSRIKMGLSQNIATLNAHAAAVAANAGVPPTMTTPSAPPGTGSSSQMMQQMMSMASQLPGQLMGMVTQVPQQMMQPLQSLTQPLQSLTSMFGGSGGKSAASSMSPFSAFSNHPLAGGSGAGGGAGLVKAASLPGSGGSPAQSAAMANLVGTSPVSVGPAGAGTTAVGGVAPVAAGGMGGGGMGMMGQRGHGGAGSTASLSAPAPLEYDLDEDVDDDW
jgi:hypothetical protein